jgi:hypothetical protein
LFFCDSTSTLFEINRESQWGRTRFDKHRDFGSTFQGPEEEKPHPTNHKHHTATLICNLWAQQPGSPLYGFRARDLVEEQNANGRSPQQTVDFIEQKFSQVQEVDGKPTVVFHPNPESQFFKKYVAEDIMAEWTTADGAPTVGLFDNVPSHFFLRCGRFTYRNTEERIIAIW